MGPLLFEGWVLGSAWGRAGPLSIRRLADVDLPYQVRTGPGKVTGKVLKVQVDVITETSYRGTISHECRIGLFDAGHTQPPGTWRTIGKRGNTGVHCADRGRFLCRRFVAR